MVNVPNEGFSIFRACNYELPVSGNTTLYHEILTFGAKETLLNTCSAGTFIFYQSYAVVTRVDVDLALLFWMHLQRINLVTLKFFVRNFEVIFYNQLVITHGNVPG